jgi:hypothetical protein
MNCGICISFFGYTMKDKKKENIPATAVGRWIANVHLLKKV